MAIHFHQSTGYMYKQSKTAKSSNIEKTAFIEIQSYKQI